MSGTVLLDTKTARTDAHASMAYIGSTFANVNYEVTNSSNNAGIYRLVTGSETHTNTVPRSLELNIPPGATETLVAVGLQKGSQYNFFLERLEFGSWILQGSRDTRSTHQVTDLEVSTSSQAAVVSWPLTHEGSYQVDITDGNSVSTEVPILDTESGKYRAVFGDLTSGLAYTTHVRFLETTLTGTDLPIVATTTFRPSAFSNLEIDAFFATYVELSWDDGDVGQGEEDQEAEFLIKMIAQNGQVESTVMDWTPDSIKTTKVTGLVPGQSYSFGLYRRGVDGQEVFQQGSRKDITTKTTTISSTVSWSTTLSISWNSLYEGATYKYKLRPTGSDDTLNGVSEARVIPRNLIPDTSYTFDLYVREENVDHFVLTTEVRTDKSGILGLNLSRHTTVSMNAQGFSSGVSTYYIANEDESVRSANFTMTDTEARDVELRGIELGSTHKFSLYRAEFGRWIKQTSSNDLDHVTVTSQVLSTATSVASSSAMIQFEGGYDQALYEISIFDVAPSDGTTPIQVKSNNEISNDGGLRSVVITGLEQDTPYWGTITVSETNSSGVVEKIPVKPFNFSTSAGATFQVTNVLASSAEFTWDAGEVQEEDGVAEFRVTRELNGTESDVTGWLPDSTSFTTANGLSPGTEYIFKLYRRGLDDSSVFQAEVTVSTKSSILNAVETASSHINVEWTTLYSGAEYVLMYTPSGGEPVTFNGGPISETQALLTNLQANTEYTIELYVMEGGELVGVAVQNLGNALTTKTSISKVVVVGAAVIGVAVVGLVVYKLKVAKVASKSLL